MRELARGGMGSVWVADHAALRTQVAVKFLAERSRLVPDAVARFSLEATAAARIRSPHVVQVFDHGISDDTPYIVMELLEGEDLSMRLSRAGRLTPDATSAVIAQVCRALERAHASGIVHRDIKPANVFLTSGHGDEMFVKVLDFGLAKHHAEGSFSSSESAFGTPHYVSPEQASSPRNATALADLWSLAVVAYECLTGARPFQGETLMAVCLALKSGRFALPTSLRPELSPAIDAWFLRALHRDPAQRFASARDFTATFDAALVDDASPISRSDETPALSVEARTTSPNVRRRRTRAAWSWIALAATGVGAIFAVPHLAERPGTPLRATAHTDDALALSIAVKPPSASAASGAPEPTEVPIVVKPAAATSSSTSRRPSRAPTPPVAAPAPTTDLFADPKK